MPIALVGVLISGIVVLGLLLAVRHGRAHAGARGNAHADVAKPRNSIEQVARMDHTASPNGAAASGGGGPTPGAASNGRNGRGRHLGDLLAVLSSQGPRQVDEHTAHQQARAVLRGAFVQCLRVCGRRQPRRPMAWVIRDVIQIVDRLRVDLETLYFACGGGAEPSETRVQTRLMAKGMARRILELLQ